MVGAVHSPLTGVGLFSEKGVSAQPVDLKPRTLCGGLTPFEVPICKVSSPSIMLFSWVLPMLAASPNVGHEDTAGFVGVDSPFDAPAGARAPCMEFPVGTSSSSKVTPPPMVDSYSATDPCSERGCIAAICSAVMLARRDVCSRIWLRWRAAAARDSLSLYSFTVPGCTPPVLLHLLVYM